MTLPAGNSSDALPYIVGYSLVEQLDGDVQTGIYRAVEQCSQRPVVIRLLQQDHSRFNDLSRFRAQFAVTEIPAIPGIAPLYSLELCGNSYALVMEDFGGISLQHYVQARSLCLQEKLAIALQVAEILHDLHQAQLTYENLNPSNILIHPESQQLKLIDLRIASLLTQENQDRKSLERLEEILGYLAPEQTGRVSRGIDHRVDFYALGVTVFELLTGRLPFSSSDPMELVHCHLAKHPPRAHHLCADIPVVVSDIINKLMAKNAEDRYQTALGLHHDLQICLHHLKATGQITAFAIATQDRCDRFQVPEKLYGREAQVQLLQAAFERVSQGNCEVVLVGGDVGIGKTTFVNQSLRQLTHFRGYFTSGTFDQCQQHFPLTALLNAYRGLIHHLLTEREDQLDYWRDRLLTYLGANAQLLMDEIPELEVIIGQQPSVPELEAIESANRLSRTLEQFSQVFQSLSHPIVCFIDNGQWADSSSTQLLRAFMQNPANHYWLLVVAYRDHEVTSSHPLMQAIEAMRQAGVTVTDLKLEPLELEHVSQLVAETLHASVEAVRPLAHLLFEKTAGNPFFLTQLFQSLHEDGLIKFAATPSLWGQQQWHGQWQWDLEQIKQRDSTDNVVELMIGRIGKLSEPTQQLLQLVACLGNSFDVQTVATVSGTSYSQAAQDLSEVIQMGLLVPSGDGDRLAQRLEVNEFVSGRAQGQAIAYRFCHDRIQQAAYSLIDENQKQATHYFIGKRLMQSCSEVEQEERIFEIVSHLNRAIELVQHPIEQEKFARLNLMAGRKAKNSNAYRVAVQYLTAGHTLLADDCWISQYDLALALYIEATESAYLNADLEQMAHLADIVLRRARTALDTVKVYAIRIDAYTSQRQFLAAINTGLTALKQFAIALPESPGLAEVTHASQAVRELLGNRQPRELLNHPEMTDPQTLAALQILNSIAIPAYLTQPNLNSLIIMMQLRLSVIYGNAPTAALTYSSYGLFLCAVAGEIEQAYAFSQLALDLLVKLKNKKIESRVLFVTSAFVLHWKVHVRDSLKLLQNAYASGWENGSLMELGYAAYVYGFYAYLAGYRLPQLEQEISAYSQTLERIKQKTQLSYNELYRQTILNLLGQTANPVLLSGEIDQERATLTRYQQANDQTGLWHFCFIKLMLCYLFYDFEQAFAYVEQAERYASGGKGMFNIPAFHFYAALTALAIVTNRPESEQSQLLQRVAAAQEKIQRWATYAPMNHLHKYHLIAAEKHRVLGDRVGAIEHYDLAIVKAKENSFIQDEALANELAAQFYLNWGKQKVAAGYMQDAYCCYTTWGAKAKTADLESRYPSLLRSAVQAAALPSGFEALATMTYRWPDAANALPSGYHVPVQHRSLNPSINTAVDFTTILKASQSLASTVQLDALLRQLTQIILQNSGSDRCALVLANPAGEWRIEATATLETTELRSSPLDGHADVPVKLIQYVKNTQAVVVINNLKTDLPVLDHYLIQQQPESVLSLPILNQGRLFGILYLENRSISNVFTSDRILILNFLCTQAAISLENARFYRELQANAQQIEQALNQQTILFNVVTQMRESLDLETIFRSVTQNVRSILNADRVGIYQFCLEQNYQYGEFLAEAVQPEFPSALAIKVQDHCFGQNYATLYKKGRICTISDVQAATVPDCHRAILQRFGIRASLAVPILQDEDLWGLLCIHQCDRPREWQPAESQFAQQVAAQMGIALKQTELLLETRRQAAELEHTLHDLQQTQLRLVQHEKMASLGNLVAGVAHEINNPVGFLTGSILNAEEYVRDLLGHLKLYQQHYPNSDASIEQNAEKIDLEFLQQDLPKLVDSMKGATERLKSISTGLRTFSRADAEHQAPVNLHEGISSTLLILKYRLKANQQRPAIQVVQDYSELPLVVCFPGQLNQVFMNILANAIDTFDEAAQQASFDALVTNPQVITIQTTAAPEQDTVEIRIRDNGMGMTADVKTKVFDHLFTTKEIGKGTGLGLAIAHQIVTEKHHGSISVKSELGQGTEFCIRLPISGRADG